MWPFTRKPKEKPDNTPYYQIAKNGRDEFFVYIKYPADGVRFCLNDRIPFSYISDAEDYIEERKYISATNAQTIIKEV